MEDGWQRRWRCNQCGSTARDKYGACMSCAERVYAELQKSIGERVVLKAITCKKCFGFLESGEIELCKRCRRDLTDLMLKQEQATARVSSYPTTPTATTYETIWKEVDANTLRQWYEAAVKRLPKVDQESLKAIEEGPDVRGIRFED